MKLIIKALVCLSIALFLYSCKKYPEGPALSLRSKKHRLAGEYHLEKFTLNGTDKTQELKEAGGPDYMFHLEEDGHYHVHGNFEDEGHWELSHDQKTLITTSEVADSLSHHAEILKLSNTALWLREQRDNGVTAEFQWQE